jgi:hypothetical protein
MCKPACRFVPGSNSLSFPQMYHWTPGPAAFGDVPRLLARIEKQEEKVKLEITLEAVNYGLLEVVVVAATLFQSGCPID